MQAFPIPLRKVWEFRLHGIGLRLACTVFIDAYLLPVVAAYVSSHTS